MTDKTSKELSRRDALKLLGAAAGATVLANLPSKWSTPQLIAGVLPAHAKTSGPAPVTCTEQALRVDFLLVPNNTQLIFATPQAGPDIQAIPIGGEVGGTGSGLIWNCDPPCILFWVVGPATGSATLRITVLEYAPFEVFLNGAGTSTYWIYLNAATGHYNEGEIGGDNFAVEGCPDVYPP